MKFTLRAKRAGSIPAMIFFVLFLTLLSISGSVFLSVGNGNPINKVTHSLWENQSLKQSAGNYLVSKTLEGATGDERKLLLKKGPQISTAITDFLGNPLLHQAIDQISDLAYIYYSSEPGVVQSIDIRPIARLIFESLRSIDPQFASLGKEIDKIEPIKLQAQKDGPNIYEIKKGLNLAATLTLLLTFLSLFLYVIFARDLKAVLRWIGLTLFIEGAFLMGLFIVFGALVAHQASAATESLAREVIPLAVHPLLAPFLIIGIFELLIGLALFLGSFLRQVSQRN